MHYRHASIGLLMATTGAVSLSVHVVMMQLLAIPYPHAYTPAPWQAFLTQLGFVLAAGVFAVVGQRTMARGPFALQVFAVALSLSALREGLVRGVLMNGLTTSFWAQAVAANLSFVTELWVSMCWFTWLWVTRGGMKRPKVGHCLAAAVIALSIHWFVSPWGREISGYLLGHLPQPLPTDAILPPYGWKILVPAYLSFAEPVIGCFALAWLSWNSLSPQPVKRMLQFTLLIALARGMVFTPFFYAWGSDMPFRLGLLSMGQFSLEVITLALLVSLTMTLLKPTAPHSLAAR